MVNCSVSCCSNQLWSDAGAVIWKFTVSLVQPVWDSYAAFLYSTRCHGDGIAQVDWNYAISPSNQPDDSSFTYQSSYYFRLHHINTIISKAWWKKKTGNTAVLMQGVVFFRSRFLFHTSIEKHFKALICMPSLSFETLQMQQMLYKPKMTAYAVSLWNSRSLQWSNT